MTRETDYLIQSLFERESLEEMTLDELKGMAEQYPYSSIIQFLYSCKLKSLYHLDFPESVTKTALYFNNPYWLNHQLSEDAEKGHFRLSNYDTYTLTEEEDEDQAMIDLEENESEATPVDIADEVDEDEEIGEDAYAEEEHENAAIPIPSSFPLSKEHEPQPEESFSIPIDPYHTVDYFASQGIDLSKEIQKDEFSSKVKSFTAWLKTMKRLQPVLEDYPEKEVDGATESAEISPIQHSDEIITEAMAEVYLKQGMKEKAIAIYKKLSLQNPGNSRSFADKILQIKENKI